VPTWRKLAAAGADGLFGGIMRLAAITTVYDSADIIEMLVRHTMRLVDRFYIHHDDGSADGTVEIIGHLRDEGLDIVLTSASSGAFYQRHVTTGLVARALADEVWDFLIVLDDDEFLTAEDRATLEGDLAAVPPHAVPALSVRHHLPSARDDPSETHPLRRMRHAIDWWPRPFKMIAPGPLMQRPDVHFTDGNHAIMAGSQTLPARVLPRVRIAHFPIRSAEQFVSRTCALYIRSKLRSDYNPDLNAHRIRIATAFRDLPGLAVSPEVLERIAHGIFLGSDATQLVEAPLDATHAERRHGALAAVRPYDRLLHAADGAIAQSRALQAELASAQARIATLVAQTEPVRPPPAATAPAPRKNAASRLARRLRRYLRRRRR
jgi:hypothetical protein